MTVGDEETTAEIVVLEHIIISVFQCLALVFGKRVNDITHLIALKS